MIDANHRRIVFMLAIIVGIGLIVSASRHRAIAKLIYNPTSSAPRGWYRVQTPADLHRGDFALVRLPAGVATFADERRYLPKTVPLVKSVAAVVGDQVCEQKGLVRINDIVVARSLQRDGAGRDLVAWTGCRRLRAGDLFLLGMTNNALLETSRFNGVPVGTLCPAAAPVKLST